MGFVRCSADFEIGMLNGLLGDLNERFCFGFGAL